MSRNLVLRMLATIMLVLTTTGTVFAEDGDGETEPSWLDRELTLCQNGVELTDTFRALIDANIVVVFGDRFHLTGEDAYVGPCDESETPGNGDGSETSDNGDGSETPGNDDGDSETTTYTLSGRVTWGNGSPVTGGVTVYITPSDDFLDPGATTTFIDVDGYFSLNGLAPGNYQVSAYSGVGTGSDVYEVAIVNADVHQNIVFIVAPNLSGTVTDEDGNPISATVCQFKLCYTAENGHYRIAGFRSLYIPMTASHPGYITQEQTFVNDGPSGEGIVNFVLQKTGDGNGAEPGDNGNGNGTENGNGNGTESGDNGNGTDTEDNGNGDGTEPGDNGNGGGTDTGETGNGDGTEIPAVTPNAFTLTLIQRMCADQSFNATWTGTNVVGIEFSLSNTSDNWTSGWLPANAETGSFTTAVDHHAYDKAVARVTFADGTSQVVDADVNLCVSVPANPPVTGQPSTPQKPVQVSALPTTGSGRAASISIVSLMTATLVFVTAGGMIVRGQRR